MSIVFYMVFSKLNETTPKYFMLVLILKWNYLSVAQRNFVLLPHVHYWFCWVLVWKILMMFLNDPWWKVMYFKIELGFYLIVHILSFFFLQELDCYCAIWILTFFFGRIWTVFMNRLIKLTPLKILLLVAFIRKVELKGGAWFPFYFSGKKVVLSILWCSSWLNQNQSPATLLLRNAYWNFWRELLRTINASVFRSGRVLWFLLSRCSSEAG